MFSTEKNKIIFKRLCIVIFLLLLSSCVSNEIKKDKKEGLFWPSPPYKPRIRYIRTFSGPGDIYTNKSMFKKVWEYLGGRREGIKLIRPYGIFVDNKKIYVADPGGRRVHIFDLIKEGYYYFDKIYKKKRFLSPISVVVDKRGYMYVSDSLLKRVFVFDNNRKFMYDIKGFDRPTGMAIYKENLYIVDTLANKIIIYQTDGSYKFSFGKRGIKDGEFNYPTNIFVDDKYLYVTDSLNFRVQIFDKDGKFINKFGRLGDGTGDFSKPKGIAVDSDGNIYVVDSYFDVVQIFNKEGRLLLAFGQSGHNKGEFLLPSGIFIDRDDRIYVADSYNSRIQIFQYIKGEL
jgi:DNA-binding beta-propeller fold protein YncE